MRLLAVRAVPLGRDYDEGREECIGACSLVYMLGEEYPFYPSGLQYP